MGTYNKNFKWQCKSFQSISDATHFTLDNYNKIPHTPTCVFDIDKRLPLFIQKMYIDYQLKKLYKSDII
jgi:hypothetical protein